MVEEVINYAGLMLVDEGSEPSYGILEQRSDGWYLTGFGQAESEQDARDKCQELYGYCTIALLATDMAGHWSPNYTWHGPMSSEAAHLKFPRPTWY